MKETNIEINKEETNKEGKKKEKGKKKDRLVHRMWDAGKIDPDFRKPILKYRCSNSSRKYQCWKN